MGGARRYSDRVWLKIAELYIQLQHPQRQLLSVWQSGHKIQLENPKWTDGCAYANEGYGVVIMSVK